MNPSGFTVAVAKKLIQFTKNADDEMKEQLSMKIAKSDRFTMTQITDLDNYIHTVPSLRELKYVYSKEQLEEIEKFIKECKESGVRDA